MEIFIKALFLILPEPASEGVVCPVRYSRPVVHIGHVQGSDCPTPSYRRRYIHIHSGGTEAIVQ